MYWIFHFQYSFVQSIQSIEQFSIRTCKFNGYVGIFMRIFSIERTKIEHLNCSPIGKNV